MVNSSLGCIDMNKRIEELADQCNWQEVVVEDGEEWIHAHFDKQKFAELIVRECANICFSEAAGHNMAFGEHCGVVIKEHFGVK